MPLNDENERELIERLADTWFESFKSALSRSALAETEFLLHTDCYWRDLLAYDWTLQTQHGQESIRRWVAEAFDPASATTFTRRGPVVRGALGDIYPESIAMFFDFETKVGRGGGVVRLVVDDASGQAKAVTILTTLRELHAATERIHRNRSKLDESKRIVERNAEDAPVLVIGAGQAGLMAAARLERMGVKAVVVDSMERVGDAWRGRYEWLNLHNTSAMNHFPYFDYPQSWPVYLSRDMLVDWLEFYARAMQLDIRTGTTVVDAVFDEASGSWAVQLQDRNGSLFELHPRHVVLAAGIVGRAKMPEIPGVEHFRGTVRHSSEVDGSLDMNGKKVVVVGAGTSAHDIAQMACQEGADITLVQRSSITVVSLEPSAAMSYQLFNEFDGVLPIEDVDLLNGSVPYDLVRRLQVGMSARMAAADEPLLSKLRKVGFLLDNGEDDTGWLMKMLRYHSGYYLNIGASELIADEKIKLRSGVGITGLTETSVVLSDGSELGADVVVLATGFLPVTDSIRQLFGEAVAERVGKVYGIGGDNEVCGMYQATGQPNLFITGGGFGSARNYSRYIALLIAADLAGVRETVPRPLEAASMRLAERIES
jgi:cation diffusion facilitator CzcD-associated flavoprotein CzcO